MNIESKKSGFGISGMLIILALVSAGIFTYFEVAPHVPEVQPIVSAPIIVNETGSTTSSTTGTSTSNATSTNPGNATSTSTSTPPLPTSPNEISLKVGGQGTIKGLTILVNSIAEDSRCPKDVTCVWAGRIAVEITLKSPGKSRTFAITTEGKTYSFDAHTISITNYSAPIAIKGQKDQSQYSFTFKVLSQI